MKDILIFIAGVGTKTVLSLILTQIIVPPISRLIKKSIHKENSALNHYFKKHPGKSYSCPLCSPELASPSTDNSPA